MAVIGRAATLTQLHNALHKSQSGILQVIALTGQAGIGKSTLVKEILRDSRKYYILDYHFFESVITPYAPFTYAVRRILKDFNLQPEQLSQFLQLSPLLPELKAKAGELDKVGLSLAIAELLDTISQTKPILFAIEDCHWADSASLELLPVLLEHLANLPCTLLLSYRTDAIPREHPVIKLRTFLRRNTGFTELKLGPLNREETKALIEDQVQGIISEELLAVIYQQTQGSPFFVKELTQALLHKRLLIEVGGICTLEENNQIPIPETIRDMVALQLDGISDTARQSVELASLLGQEFSLELLSEMTSQEQSIDELFLSGVLIEKDAKTGAFSHALVREVIRQDIVWSRRRQLNLKIAQELEKQQAPQELLAQYWLDGGDKTKAQQALVSASRDYCRLHAHADAARTAHKALEIWPKGNQEELRVEVLQQFAGCSRISGQVHHSIKALRELLESPLIQENPARLGETYRALAISYALQGTWQHYKQCRQKAAEAFETAGLWAEATLDWHELAIRCVAEFAVQTAFETAGKALVCALKSGERDLQAGVLSTKAYVLAMQGKGEESQQLAQKAVNLALESNHPETYAYAYRKYAGSLEYDSNFKGSIQAYEKALNYCRTQNLQDQSLFCMPCISWLFFRLGDWKRSLEACQELTEAGDTDKALVGFGYLLISLIRTYRGETKSASHAIKQASLLLNQTEFYQTQSILYWALAAVSEHENEAEKACYHYTQLLQHWEKTGDVHDILPGLGSAMAFFSSHHMLQESVQCVQVLSSIANLTGNAEAVATLSFALGEMAVLQHNFEEARLHYAHAAEAFTEISIPLQLMLVFYKKGRLHAGVGEQKEALEVLQQASLLAKSLGVRPMLSAITTLLEEVTGNRVVLTAVPQPVAAPAFGLTERQMEILHALVDGLSNKEIASRLDLSTRTIDMHVRHLFDRLNCRTRTEAVRIALEKKLFSQPVE